MSIASRARTRLSLFALSMPALLASLACSSEGTTDPGPTAGGPTEGSVTAEGTVAIYTATQDDGTREDLYYVRQGEQETRLFFSEIPDLVPGARIEVRGAPREGGIEVLHYHAEAYEDVAIAREALIDAPAQASRRFAFVRVDIGGGINLTVDDAQRRLFGTGATDGSVKQYYTEVSYGTQDITGDVLGPFSYSMFGCDTRGMASTLKAQIGQYDHYLWYMGSRTASCNWSGLAESGRPGGTANDTWYNGSAGCVVLVQEPGHNFGMMHSSAMRCGGAAFADNPELQCEHDEYGDRYDPMGGGCNHMNAWQKVFEGWLQKCNGVRANSTGTFTLRPLEVECNGIQVLQIPMPKVRPFSRSGGGGQATTENIAFYYLELRTARGFDQSIRVAPTVLVHVGEDFRSRQESGRHSWILDMDPATTRTLEGLGAGQGYQDPAGGVRFDVTSLSADGATISVTTQGSGGPTCLDDSAYDANATAECAGIATGSGGSPGTGGGPGSGGAGGTGAGGAASDVPRMEAYTLINADTDTEIQLVPDGAVLDLDTLPPSLTLRADPAPAIVGSVAFQLDGAAERVESIAPYSLSSDDGQGNFAPWSLQLGTHTVTGTPWGSANASGVRGEPLTVTFTLARGVATGGATGAGGVSAGGLPGLDTGGVTATGGFGLGGDLIGSGGAAPGAGGNTLPAGPGGFGAGGAGTVPPAYGAGSFPPFGAPAWPGAGGMPINLAAPAEEESCTCRVPGSRNVANDAARFPAVALALGALALRRGRRRSRGTHEL